MVMVGENGDILAKYRIPAVGGNKADFTLQLPDDKDSSDATSQHIEDDDEDGQP